MAKHCKCGHEKESHLVHQFEDGAGPQASTHCNNCGCKEYAEAEICEKCGMSLKPSQYARKEKSDGSAWKDTEHLVCRNYPNCSKAEKEIETQEIERK